MAKPPKARKDVQISIDLVEAALAQRQFLQLVDEHPCLYDGPHVQNAVRRCASRAIIQSVFVDTRYGKSVSGMQGGEPNKLIRTYRGPGLLRSLSLS